MATETIDLKIAFAVHRAHLDTLEGISKVATKEMQLILAVDLQAFDKRLNSWATAVPLQKSIAIHDAHRKQP